MDKIYEQLDVYMFEILAELNAPCTKDMLIGYMEDGESVNEAYQEMTKRIEKYFVDEYGVESASETIDSTSWEVLKEFVKGLVDEYPLGDANAKKIFAFYQRFIKGNHEK